MIDQISKHPASFRDHAGYVFFQAGKLYRVIRKSFQTDYDQLTKSAFYNKLIKAKLLVSHQEVEIGLVDEEIYKVIEPELVSTISYPYEWSFSQLKDAALLTLQVQELALQNGFILRDASAYNIQFSQGAPILIDTLSLGIYKPGSLWDAYGQFCRHFLAPLALLSLVDVRMQPLWQHYLDGVPLDLATKLLPTSAKFKLSLALHLHLQAKIGQFNKVKVNQSGNKFTNQQSLLRLVESLRTAILSLPAPDKKTIWGDYYTFTNYNDQAFASKKELLLDLFSQINPKPKVVWDIGGNDGTFAKLVASQGCQTVVFDSDQTSIDRLYQEVKKQKIDNILPLLIDLYNPSPALGWLHTERQSWLQRAKADLALGLALIHHLRIGNNLPWIKIAEFFSFLGNWLIVEYVPKEDSQVQLLLTNRQDIFADYDQMNFEKYFTKYFTIQTKQTITSSQRVLYLLKKNV